MVWKKDKGITGHSTSLFDENDKNEKRNILKGSAIPDEKKNRRKANGSANKRKMQQKQQVHIFVSAL